jgi:N-methylhydantoinase A
VHACEVAEELGIGRVIFPPHASTLSAWGILWSDITHDLAATQIAPLASAGPALAEQAQRLLREAGALLDEDGVEPAQRGFEWSADCRYAGQAFELPVPLATADFCSTGLDALAEGFHRIHRQRFSHEDRGVPVEIVALRLTARGRLARRWSRKPIPPPTSPRAGWPRPIPRAPSSPGAARSEPHDHP